MNFKMQTPKNRLYSPQQAKTITQKQNICTTLTETSHRRNECNCYRVFQCIYSNVRWNIGIASTAFKMLHGADLGTVLNCHQLRGDKYAQKLWTS